MNKIELRYSDLSTLDLLDIYYPDNPNGEVIINFHGGGFTCGSKNDDSQCELGREFAELGYTFVSVDYSLYPNTKFPNYLVEASQAVKFVCDYFKVKHPFITGQSAGAWLAMMMCFSSYLKDEGVNPLDIKGWIFESGQPTSHFNIMNIERNLDPYLQRIDEIAPLFYIYPDVKMSPALVVLYEDDLPNRYQQNQLLISTVKNYNHNVDITDMLLPGGHCASSTIRNEKGEFPFVKAILPWLESHK